MQQQNHKFRYLGTSLGKLLLQYLITMVYTILYVGYFGYTQAFNPSPDFSLQWVFLANKFAPTSNPPNTAVCMKNTKGIRIIIKAVSTVSYDCYVINAVNGEEVSKFECGGSC